MLRVSGISIAIVLLSPFLSLAGDKTEPPDPSTLIHIGIGFVIIIIVIGLIGRRLTRAVGCNCYNCGARVAPWDELASDEQQDILRYFKQYENREPDTKKVFLCRPCGIVYDDFSGESETMQGDTSTFCKACRRPGVDYLATTVRGPDILDYQKKNPDLIDKTECLSCKREPFSVGDCLTCDTPLKVLGCRRCGTLYSWMPLLEKGYSYCTPLTKIEVLENAPKGVDAWGIDT